MRYRRILSQPGRVSADALNRGVQALHHRGPDNRNTWISPRGHVALGHARLSIIDLETGTQPIANEDERAWIVVNGEFYDYERVQQDLERDGHRLRTRSDSEIALHLYEDLGTECMHQRRGYIHGSFFSKAIETPVLWAGSQTKALP